MNTEEFWKSKEINTFEKLLLVYLQFNDFKSVKELALIFSVSEVTLRRAFAKLRKLELISKSGVSKLILNNNGCIKTDTKEKSECINIDTNCIKSDTKSIKTDTNSEKNTHIYINTNNITNTNSINKEEGKSSLTSFASTSLKYYIDKFNFVNDLGHENLNQIKNSLIPTETDKTSLAEIAKAPAKRKRAKSQFNPPTAEQVEEYMKQYVDKEKEKTPKLLDLDLYIMSKKFIATYSDDWSKVKNWKNKTITWLYNQIEWNRNRQTPYQQKQEKKEQALSEIEKCIEESLRLEKEDQQKAIESKAVENKDGTFDVDFWGKEI